MVRRRIANPGTDCVRETGVRQCATEHKRTGLSADAIPDLSICFAARSNWQLLGSFLRKAHCSLAIRESAFRASFGVRESVDKSTVPFHAGQTEIGSMRTRGPPRIRVALQREIVVDACDPALAISFNYITAHRTFSSYCEIFLNVRVALLRLTALDESRHSTKVQGAYKNGLPRWLLRYCRVPSLAGHCPLKSVCGLCASAQSRSVDRPIFLPVGTT